MSTAPPITLIPKSPAEVAKSILFIVVALVAVLRASLVDGVSPAEGLQLVITFVTLVPVYLLAGTAVKTIVAFASAGLQALVVPFSVLIGWSNWSSISIDDWIGAFLIAFAAIGIAVVPNKPMIDARDSGVVTSLK